MERLKDIDWINVFIVGFIILAVFGFALLVIGLVFSITETEFQERDKQVQECLLSERYTRQECIDLAGDE